MVELKSQLTCYLTFCQTSSLQDGGQYLLAVDESNDHVMSIWDWQKGEKGHKIAEAKVWILAMNVYCVLIVAIIVIIEIRLLMLSGGVMC